MFQVPHHDIIKYGIILNSRKLSVYAGYIEEYYAFYYRSLPGGKGVNGFEFARAVSQIKPEIKIL